MSCIASLPACNTSSVLRLILHLPLLRARRPTTTPLLRRPPAPTHTLELLHLLVDHPFRPRIPGAESLQHLLQLLIDTGTTVVREIREIGGLVDIGTGDEDLVHGRAQEGDL